MAAAENIAYDELFRSSDTHELKEVYFRGEVIQVLGDTGLWNLRVNVTPGDYGFWDDTVFIEFYGDQRYLEDDIIDFVGTFTGPHTYESVMGGEVTIPGILIWDDVGIAARERLHSPRLARTVGCENTGGFPIPMPSGDAPFNSSLDA